MDHPLPNVPAAGPGRRSLANRAVSAFSFSFAVVLHRIQDFFRRHPVSPLLFLAVAFSVGLGATLVNTYDLSYVVTVDGVDVGVVHEVSTYQRAVNSVEARASSILHSDYSIESTVEYTPVLVEKGNFTSIGTIESYLFNHIGEIAKGYDLVIDGKVHCSADDLDDIEALLAAVVSPYVSDNTLEYGFMADVSIESNYITSESNLDLQKTFQYLTANTTGETTYTVVSGDTYSEIAQANDMTLDELMALNPQARLDSLFVGDVLTVNKIIPFLSVYTVDQIIYTTPVESPVEYVDDPSMYIGTNKVITSGTGGEAEVTAKVTYVNGYETERSVLSTVVTIEPTKTVIARGSTERPKTASTGKYIWPCEGYISSSYGYRNIFGGTSFHGGLDIANYKGTTIVASDGGKVTFAGWNSGGYGYLVIITHDNGDKTYYAHNSSLLVSVGERVYQGQAIAKMGSTGRSTGNHCHFEIRINGSRVNPRKYLPSR